MPNLVKNSRATYEYDIIQTFDAGLVLEGREVKSVKAGNSSLQGSYVSVLDGEVFLVNCHIGPYKYAPADDYDPIRRRKLLLNKAEIEQLVGKEKGLAIIPLEIYGTSRGNVKVKIGLGRARKKTDKREYIKERDTKKEIRKHQDR